MNLKDRYGMRVGLAEVLLTSILMGFLFFGNSVRLYGQENDVFIRKDSIELDQVTIISRLEKKEKKWYGIPSLKSIDVDSSILQMNLSQSIGDILSQQTGVFIKDYGPSGIKTPSFRGMSASHTKIYVNGLDISPSSLGQSDLSILPSFLFNGIKLNYGNTSFTEGSGAIGGGVMLATNAIDAPMGTSMNIGGSYGSFNSQALNGSFSYRDEKWESVTRLLYKASDNDFTFYNIAQAGYPEQTQTHSKLAQQGFSQTIRFRLKPTTDFKLVVIGTSTQRELPGFMTAINASEETQEDVLLSTQLSWKQYFNQGYSNMILGYSRSLLNYVDPLHAITSVTINEKYQYRVDYVHQIGGNWNFKTMGLMDYSTANNQNLNGTQSILQYSALLGIKGKLSPKWEMGAYIQPTVNGTSFEWLPMANVAFMPLDNSDFTLGLNVAQNAHFPTLNDLYWSPGGNPDLLPEKASQGEFNVHWNNEIEEPTHFSLDGAVFYGWVDNWILWQPTDLSYWAPENIKSVQHSGVDLTAKAVTKLNAFSFTFLTNYQWVQAINKGVDDESFNKQLIYTPENIWNWTLISRYKKYWVSFNYIFTGLRYTTATHSSYLPAYDLINIALGTDFYIRGKQRISTQIDIKNVLSKSYMSVAYQAMPGISVGISARYYLNKN